MVELASTAESSDIELLFVLLAFIAFAVAVFLAYRRDFIAAVGAALVGAVIIIFGA